MVQRAFRSQVPAWTDQGSGRDSLPGKEGTMSPRRRTTLAAMAVVVVAVGVGGAAVAGRDDEAGSSDYTRQQAADATKAALDATGGGKANSVERDSENGATWEVEVTEPDGDTIDVRLDEHYDVVVIEGDSDSKDSSD
jgi:hypothetical protein